MSFRTQAQDSSLRIGVNVSEGIRFYEVDATGRAELLLDLSDEFAFYPQGMADWIILTPEAIQVSSQGNRAAFVAFRRFPGSTFEEASLFWFELAQPVLNQVVLPGAFAVEWSPDESQILLGNMRFGVEFAAVSQRLHNLNSYVLTLSTGNLEQLPAPSGNVRSYYTWLGGYGILYFEASQDCTAPCIRAVDIFLLDPATQATSRLTDIGHQLLADVSANTLQYYSVCSPSHFSWSASTMRLYYAVTCFDGADQRHAYLYSTDLAGNGRIEVDLPALYPEDLYTAIRGIELTENEVYFAVESETRPQSGALEFNSWLIFLLDQNGLQVISDTKFPGSASADLNVIEFAPNKPYVALAGANRTVEQPGYLEVVDLSTGQTLIQITSADHICNLEWLNAQHILYSAFALQCEVLTNVPVQTGLLNISTGMQEIVSGDEPLWLLPPVER